MLGPDLKPVVDRRDGYRAEVDRACAVYGKGRYWDAEQITRAKRICYRTVWAESDWRLLANRSVPESIDIVPNDGYGADLDSTGLFQQRESQGWGSVLGSMDPYTATVRFLTEMEQLTPDWSVKDKFGGYFRTEADVCQRTQRSQFDGDTIDPSTGRPFLYAANYVAHGGQTDALAADVLYFTHKAGG